MKKYIPYVLVALILCLLAYFVQGHIKEYHLQDDPMLPLLKSVLEPVHPIVSKLRLYKGDKSYTLNKERIFLCLYDQNGDYYPINMLIYVLLHEIAHQLNDIDVGHTEAFNNKFDELLQKATDLKIYNPSIPVVQNYCNMN